MMAPKFIAVKTLCNIFRVRLHSSLSSTFISSKLKEQLVSFNFEDMKVLNRDKCRRKQKISESAYAAALLWVSEEWEAIKLWNCDVGLSFELYFITYYLMLSIM